MAWRFVVQSVTRNENDQRKAEAVILYTDDARKEVRRHLVGSKAELVSVITQTLGEYAAADALVSLGTDIDITPVVVAPTKNETDGIAWFKRKALEDSQLALSRYSAELQADYKPEYGSLR